MGVAWQRGSDLSCSRLTAPQQCAYVCVNCHHVVLIAGRSSIVFVYLVFVHLTTIIRSSIGVGRCVFDRARNLLKQAKIYMKL
jgi:hypothetical protein